MELHPHDVLSDQQEPGLWLEGIVKSMTVRGNVRRYEIQAQDIDLSVDELNVPHKSAVDEELFIKVWIPASACNLLE
jgi:putative spermidine/putrescine transport system ATP-binding protein